MNIDQLGRLTKKRARNTLFGRFFPIATVLEIFQQTIPEERVETFC